MPVVAIHPDSASLEFHLEAGDPEFREFAALINLQTIEVYGRPSEKALAPLRQKAEMLGQDASVTVHDFHDGFAWLVAAGS